MKSRRRWFFGLALTLPLAVLVVVLSSMQLASADTEQAAVSHWFYGHLYNMDGSDMPAGATVEARDDANNVIWTGIEGNPITTEDAGMYGTQDPDNPSITDDNLAVQGAAEDMYEGLPVSFYVNGAKAEVRECGSEGDWQDTYPWRSDAETCLDIRGGEPCETDLVVEAGSCCSVTVDGVLIPAGSSDDFVDTCMAQLEVITGSECCNFVEWQDGSGAVITDVASFRYDTGGVDKTVRAICETPDYNLVANAEGEGPDWGGDVVLEPASGPYACGETVTATAEASGFGVFDQWSGDFPDGQEFDNPIAIYMDADKEITATFQEGPPEWDLSVESAGCFTVTVDEDGVDRGMVAPDGTAAMTVTAGATVTLETVGTCCSLDEWTYETTDGTDLNPLEQNGKLVFRMRGDYNVVATSHGPPFSLDVSAGGDGDGTIDPADLVGVTTGYTPCGTTVELTATENENSTWGGWTGDVESMDKNIEVVLDSDKEIQAVFNMKTYTVTFPDPGDIDGGEVTVTDDEGNPVNPGDTVEYSTTLTFEAAADECYTFTGWLTDLADYTETVVDLHAGTDVTGDLDFSAQFEQLVVDMTYFVEGEGDILVDPDEEGYLCGTAVTVTAQETDACWTFGSWSGNLSGDQADPVKQFFIREDKVFTATFNQGTRHLDVTVDRPAGMVTGTVEPGTGDYPCGDTLTVTAIPDPLFVEWMGDLMGDVNPETLPMTDDMSITAVFTYGAVTGIDVTPDDPTVVVSGTVDFTVDANDDWESEWDVTDGATFTATGGTIDANGVYTAPGDPGTYTVTVSYPGQEDVEVVVTVVEGFTLDVYSVGSGSVTKTPDKATYEPGEEVQLDAIPSGCPEAAFEGWSGDLGGAANPETIIMDGNKVVTATFYQCPSEKVLDGIVDVSRFTNFDGVTLTVRFKDAGATVGETVVDVDADGAFTVTEAPAGVDPAGTYSVCVKELRTLASCQSGVTLPAVEPSPVDFGDLTTGDANNDNQVNTTDFSKWLAGFKTMGYQLYADLNNDGADNTTDFSVWLAVFKTMPSGDDW